MSPNILDLGVDLQVDLENDVPDLKFLDSQGKQGKPCATNTFQTITFF